MNDETKVQRSIASEYVTALAGLVEATKLATESEGKAWNIVTERLAGKDEEAVVAFFDAATDELKALGTTQTDPRRIACRNHKSLLVGVIKRGEVISAKMGKTAVQKANSEARKAKRESDESARSPGESTQSLKNASAGACFAAFLAKLDGMDSADALAQARAAHKAIGQRINELSAKSAVKKPKAA